MFHKNLFIFLNIDQQTGEILKEAKIEIQGPSLHCNIDTAEHLVPYYGFNEYEIYNGKNEEYLNGLQTLPMFYGWI